MPIVLFKTYIPTNLTDHIISRHTDKNKIIWFECDKCSYKAKVLKTFRRHQKLEHSDLQKWFECDQCSYKSLRVTNLQRHIYCMHTDDSLIKWQQCDKCTYQAKTLDTLLKHSRQVHGNV